MNDQYNIVPWDSETRFLVVKNGTEGYLVDLNMDGLGFAMCGCRWFETKTMNQILNVSPCKHLLMVRRLVEARDLFRKDRAA